jgi:hypothetical protein
MPRFIHNVLKLVFCSVLFCFVFIGKKIMSRASIYNYFGEGIHDGKGNYHYEFLECRKKANIIKVLQAKSLLI